MRPSWPLTADLFSQKMLRVDCHSLVYVLGSPLLEVLGGRCKRFTSIVYFFYNHNGIDTDDYHHTVLY